MPEIPIDEVLPEVINRLRRGECPNEASVSSGCVLPLLQSLGWPVFKTSVVAPEYTVGSGRVDYALRGNPDAVDIFIEVKAVGNVSGQEQLFRYAFEQGVPVLILTNGEDWSFYYALGQGPYNDRRIYKLNILERDISVVQKTFMRYLSFESVRIGEARRCAEKDCGVARTRKIAKNQIPNAWITLIQSADQTLTDLIADAVEDACGHRPSLDDIQEYLQNTAKTKPTATITTSSRSPHHVRAHTASTSRSHGAGYSFGGNWISCKSAREVASESMRCLIDRDSTWPQRFMSRKHGRSRRYLSTDKYDLYPGRPDLADIYSYELEPGLWLGVNYNKSSFEKIMRLAIDVAGLQWGDDYSAEF